ncbi:MAG TPA: fumarylacetoacetate hydrolase family protein [Ktedonobacterales bacterium]|jgi:2-keto-4-pentenoate hydratase/2-oxohepta-3-ene-1,7-dioic acid hydratase in catechol pathway
MRIARFIWHNAIRYGVVDALEMRALHGDPFGYEGVAGLRAGAVLAPLAAVQVLAPCAPGKVFLVGRNYAKHVQELAHEIPTEPLISQKPITGVVGPEAAIVHPGRLSQNVHYEGELAVVIGRTCHRVEGEHALEYVLGYTCANDVTARDLQERDGQWTRAKGFDTFCPLGPWIETRLDPSDLRITTRLNGEVKQDGTTDTMLFPVARLISHVSQFVTLAPGDVLLTGTPEGVGPMQPGDTVEVEISGIGVLRNHLVAED